VPDLRSSLLIAVSGYAGAADRDKARAAVFSHYLTKPADPAALADLIAASGNAG
jgi:CheY-like chemotaxis protein